MKYIKEQTNRLRRIPREVVVELEDGRTIVRRPRWEKIRDSLIGAGSIAIGFVVLKWFSPPIPAWSFGFFIAFGFWSISKELLVGFLGYIPATIREIRDAFGLGGK